MNRFGTFARNRQNGFVALTFCFVAEAGDDTFAAMKGRLSARAAAAFCPFDPQRAASAATGVPAAQAIPAAAVRAHPVRRAAATDRPVAAGVARHPGQVVLPAVAGAAAD